MQRRNTEPSNSSHAIQFVNTKFMDLMGNVSLVRFFFFRPNWSEWRTIWHVRSRKIDATQRIYRSVYLTPWSIYKHTHTHTNTCPQNTQKRKIKIHSSGGVFKKFARLATIPFRFLRSNSPARFSIIKLDIYLFAVVVVGRFTLVDGK